MESKNRLLSYLAHHPAIPFVIEYIGDPFIEFGIVVDNPYFLRTALQQIEESFPQNRLMDVFLIQKEFLSIGPPAIVFR